MRDASERFFSAVSAALELDTSSLPPDASRDTLEAWDSIKHMYLILELEAEFGIEFSDTEIDELGTLADLMQAMRNKTGMAVHWMHGAEKEKLRD